MDAGAGDTLPEVAGTPADRNEALRQAAASGDADQVTLLLASGADPNAADEEGWTALHWAAEHVAVVRILLEAGAAVDARDAHGKTTLHWAATEGHADVAEALLSAGAGVDALDEDRWTPLQWAHAHVPVAALLLGAGAEVDAADKFGKTCLHWACQDGRGEVVRVLLGRGADASRRDHDGMTPLHWSSMCGRLEAVQLLLDAGAGPCIEVADSQRLTPLAWAAHGGHDGIVAVLLDHSRQQQEQQQEQEQEHTLLQPSPGAAAVPRPERVIGLHPETLNAAADMAYRMGHLEVFATLLVELGCQDRGRVVAVVRHLLGPGLRRPSEDVILALVIRSALDRRRLEDARRDLDRQREQLRLEARDLESVRLGLQHLIVQGAGVAKQALHLAGGNREPAGLHSTDAQP